MTNQNEPNLLKQLPNEPNLLKQLPEKYVLLLDSLFDSAKTKGIKLPTIPIPIVIALLLAEPELAEPESADDVIEPLRVIARDVVYRRAMEVLDIFDIFKEVGGAAL